LNIDELRKKPHLSASSVNDYIDCGLQYKFGRVDNLPREYSPDTMEYGSAIHRTLADFYQEKMIGNTLSLPDIHALFETHWKKAAQVIPYLRYSTGKNFTILLNEGKELLKAYYENVSDEGFTTIAIEEPVGFYINGLDVPIVGYIDLMEEDDAGTLIITDWKTSGKAYSLKDINTNMQLTIYQMAMKAMGHTGEILLKLDVLIKTKQPKFEPYYTSRTQEDEKRVIKKIQAVWQGIQKGVFIPNDTSWKCYGCVYKTYCNNYFLEEAI
jgi:putative RecB family exonuclease